MAVVFESATPVLRSADYPRARRFMTESLGFAVVEEGGDPARFGIFRRGRATVFVDAWAGGPVPHAGWSAYIHVSDVDALAADLAGRGVPVATPPHTTGYGMRELDVTDPDGNRLCFGCDAPE